MPTLTNDDVRFAYNRMMQAGNQDLPLKVSYAITRTKNKHLEPEAKTFEEKTQDLDPESDEYQEHLDHEVDVECHCISTTELDGLKIAPEIFIGFSFLFSEHENLKTEDVTFANDRLIAIINTLSAWASLEFLSGTAVLQISAAIENLRRDAIEIETHLAELDEQIEEKEDDQETQHLEEKRRRFLREKTDVSVTKIDIRSIVDGETDINVRPQDFDILEPFLLE